jgi:hypothetical protein
VNQSTFAWCRAYPHFPIRLSGRLLIHTGQLICTRVYSKLILVLCRQKVKLSLATSGRQTGGLESKIFSFLASAVDGGEVGNFRLWPLYTRERTLCTLHVLEKRKPLSRIGIRPPERSYRSLVDIRTMPPQLFSCLQYYQMTVEYVQKFFFFHSLFIVNPFSLP